MPYSKKTYKKSKAPARQRTKRAAKDEPWQKKSSALGFFDLGHVGRALHYYLTNPFMYKLPDPEPSGGTWNPNTGSTAMTTTAPPFAYQAAGMLGKALPYMQPALQALQGNPQAALNLIGQFPGLASKVPGLPTQTTTQKRKSDKSFGNSRETGQIYRIKRRRGYKNTVPWI